MSDSQVFDDFVIGNAPRPHIINVISHFGSDLHSDAISPIGSILFHSMILLLDSKESIFQDARNVMFLLYKLGFSGFLLKTRKARGLH